MDPISIGLLGAGAIGGLAKGLFGGGGLTGHREKAKQFQNYTPEQRQAMDFMRQQGLANTNFDDIRNNEINSFQRQTIPTLAERFTAMGGSGQRSSGFQNALGMAGTDLHSRLAALRSQFGLQQMNMGLRPQFENVMMPRQAGGIEQMFGGMASMAPMMAYSSLMGQQQQSPKQFIDQMPQTGANMYNPRGDMMY